MDRKSRGSAFTLAEVLITLGIIGVVAAITIPILINTTNDTEYKTAYKKAFSDASNVWQQMRVNNEIESCGVCDNDCTGKNLVAFRSYFQTTKTCGTAFDGTDSVLGCWDVTGESSNEVASGGSNPFPRKTDGSAAIGFVDNSGRDWIMIAGGALCRVPIMVDTNGFKSPNRIGKDRFFILGGLENGTVNNPIGVPTKLYPDIDRSAVTQLCGYPPCNGTSWLYQ